MKPIRTIVIEDEAPSRRRIKRLVEKETGLMILGEAENGEDAIHLITKEKPDLVLLDIQLKDMTGFQVLQSLDGEINFHIIFITAFDEYAIRAFEANALDYLLKPFKEKRFSEAISKAKKIIELSQYQDFGKFVNSLSISKEDERIKVNEGKRIHYFNPDEILYIKSESYYCNFYVEGIEKPKIIRISLKELSIILPKKFSRINKSIIINTNKIRSSKTMKKSIEITLADGSNFVAKRTFGHLEEILKSI